MERRTLFSTRLFGGLKSARHALSLEPGEASDARNLRKEPGGPIKVRLGIAAIDAATGLDTAFATNPYKGASEYYDDGTLVHQIIAWKRSSDSQTWLYRKAYTKSTSTWGDWTAITAASGKFGDTRFSADPTNGRCNFFWAEIPAADQTTTGEDYHSFRDATVCVMTNGAAVRIADTDIIVNGAEIGDASKLCSHAKAIPPPVGNLGVEFDAYDWLDMSLAATVVDGGTDWATPTTTASVHTFATAAGSGTPAVLTGGQTSYITFDADTIALGTYTSDTDYWLPKQVFLVAKATDLAYFENVDAVFRYKIGAGAYTTKSFPSAPLILPTIVDDYYFVVYDVPDLLPKDASDIHLGGVGFTSRVTTPVSCSVPIYAIGTGGVVPGGTEYGINRRSRSSHIVSPGVVLHNTTFGTKKVVSRTTNDGILDATSRDEFNGIPSTTIRTNSRGLPAKFVLPIDSRVYYTPKLKLSEPHQGDLDNYAADYVQIYRKEPGDPDYYRVDRIPFGFYATGAWNYGTPASGSAESAVYTYTDTTAQEYREFADRLSDESCSPPKPFQAGADLGPRSIVLEDNVSGTNVRISEHGQPLRFVDGVAISDDTKAGFNLRISKEKGKAVAQSAFLGGTAESSQALVFTDQSVWAPFRMEGDVVLFDLRRVNTFGSASFSTGEGKGSVAWIDKDRDVRIIGQDTSVSRYEVSDILNAIGTISIADIAYWNGRVYIAYSIAAGTSNTRVLVYNVQAGYWECYDTFPAGKEPQQFFNWRIDGANDLHYIDASGRTWQYEKAATYTDDAADISFLLETGEVHNNDFDPVSVESVGVIADTVSDTVNTTRTETEASATEVGTIDLSTGTTRTWKWDKVTGKSEIPGIEGPGVRIKLDCDFSVACSFYTIVAEMEGLNDGLGGADR